MHRQKWGYTLASDVASAWKLRLCLTVWAPGYTLWQPGRDKGIGCLITWPRTRRTLLCGRSAGYGCVYRWSSLGKHINMDVSLPYLSGRNGSDIGVSVDVALLEARRSAAQPVEADVGLSARRVGRARYDGDVHCRAARCRMEEQRDGQPVRG